jgi:phosphohistidine phosphatase
VGRAIELYLVRHGLAEDRGPAWPDDSTRPLTAEGAARLRKAIRGLRRLDVSFDVIVTSPLLRTRQSADILAETQDPPLPVVPLDVLAPGSTPAAVIAALDPFAQKGRIAVVGHEPGIGELASKLMGLRHSLEFKKGAVCRIDVDRLPPTSPGRLRWFLTPKIAGAIRKP